MCLQTKDARHASSPQELAEAGRTPWSLRGSVACPHFSRTPGLQTGRQQTGVCEALGCGPARSGPDTNLLVIGAELSRALPPSVCTLLEAQFLTNVPY